MNTTDLLGYLQLTHTYIHTYRDIYRNLCMQSSVPKVVLLLRWLRLAWQRFNAIKTFIKLQPRPERQKSVVVVLIRFPRQSRSHGEWAGVRARGDCLNCHSCKGLTLPLTLTRSNRELTRPTTVPGRPHPPAHTPSGAARATKMLTKRGSTQDRRYPNQKQIKTG